MICSISHAFDDSGKESTIFSWPYTLHNDTSGRDKKVGQFLRLWGIPVYAVMIPPALRAKYNNKNRVKGLDWNLWYENGFCMDKEDYVDTLIYSLEHILQFIQIIIQTT